jgi:hypothetical protein
MDRTDEQRAGERTVKPEVKTVAQPPRPADDDSTAEERRRDAYRLG